MTIETVLQTASRADYGFQNVPIIDMEGADGDPALRQQIAKDIRDACVNVGFFYVKNHGIPEDLMFNALDVGRKFFSLPEETKLKYDSRNTSNLKGYTAFLVENIDPANRGDLHEGFDVGPEVNDPAANESLENTYGANKWPAEVPEFKEQYMKYYNAAVAFGNKMFPLFALALGVEESYFDDKTKDDAVVMRILHYPPQTGPHDDRLMGVGAHTDFEVLRIRFNYQMPSHHFNIDKKTQCFTILWQQPDIQTLQVLNAKREWVNATPIPGTLVINIGDLFMRWSSTPFDLLRSFPKKDFFMLVMSYAPDDVFKSTVHRAINRSGVERYSIPLFFGVDYHTKLEYLAHCAGAMCPHPNKPIPSCVSAERPARYEVVTAGEYTNQRLVQTYKNAVKPVGA